MAHFSVLGGSTEGRGHRPHTLLQMHVGIVNALGALQWRNPPTCVNLRLPDLPGCEIIFPGPQWSRIHLPKQEMPVQPLGDKVPLDKEMAIHSSLPIWKIPGTEEPGGLQSIGLQRLGHNWATEHKLSLWSVPSTERGFKKTHREKH